VVQQRSGTVAPGISRPGDAREVEADRLATAGSHAVSGHAPEVAAPAATRDAGAGGTTVQRWPGDGMTPPGDCSWKTYLALRAAVEAAKAVVNSLGGCRATDSCVVLALKIGAISAEIAARVAIATKCFRGGDTDHRKQIDEKVTMLSRCWPHFIAEGCPELLAAAAAAVAAAEEVVVEGATAVEEAVVVTEELVEGAAVAGEAAVEGVTLLEVLEGIGLVLAL